MLQENHRVYNNVLKKHRVSFTRHEIKHFYNFPRSTHNTHTDLHELTNLKQTQSRVVDELETTNRAESKKEKKAKKEAGEAWEDKKKQKEGKLKNIP